MRTTKLADGTLIFCLLPTEASVLDHHVAGYFNHGISLSSEAIVFDVGANIGVFGVRVLQNYKDAQVFAFEPIPDIYQCLKKNSEAVNNKRFHTFPVGISDQQGELVFTYYPHSPALSTGKPEQWSEKELREAVDGSIKHPPPHLRITRLLPSFIRAVIAHWFAKRMRSNAQEFTVNLIRISEVINTHQLERIDLLKIDCEGAELECLLGIDPEHWPLIKQVVVEVHDQNGLLERVKTRLHEMGLSAQVTEQEEALRETSLYNIFARRMETS
jgi:FkbM family methyltransferase